MEKRLVDLTKTDVLEDSDYLFVNHGDNPVQVSFPFIKEQIAPNDTTLSESGKFADAKVVGDKLNEHSQSIETINTEIEAIKADYATKQETETKTHAEETFATKASLSSLQEDLNGVKEDYLTKQEDQENRDTEFYEGRKYNGMTYAGKTSDKGVQLHSVKGKTVQQTTNGYQLLNYNGLDKTTNGITAKTQSDGTITLNGTSTNTVFINVGFSAQSGVTIHVKINNPVANNSVMFKFNAEDQSSAANFLRFDTTNKTSDVTFTSDCIDISIRIELGTTLNNFTFKPMLYQDGDGTWEPYTGGKPAPNPDYPMEIENVEIREITSQSKNLFDKNSVAKTRVTFNGKEFVFDPTNEDATLMMPIETKYIKTGNKFYFSFYAKIEGTPKKAYSDLFPDVLSTDISLDVTEEYKKFSGYLTVRDDKQTNPRFRIYINTSATTKLYVKDVMLSFGEESEYLPYGHDTVDTSLTLAEGDSYENGQVTRVRKQITFDGSSDENWRIITNNRFQINISGIKNNGYTVPKGVCDRLKAMALNDMGTTSEWGLISCHDDNVYLRISESVTTVEQLRTWLSTHPLTVEYELKTPTTEEFKIPTVPSYFPYTEVSTDNELETDMTWKVLADCDNSLKQEELEQRILALETKAIE